MSYLKSFFKKTWQFFQMKLVWKLRRRIFFQKIGNGLPSIEPSHSILSRTFSLEHLPFSESKTWLQHYREVRFQIIPADLADAMNELILSINLGRQTENIMLKDKEFHKLIKKYARLWAKYDNESEVKPEVYLEEDTIFYEMEQLNSYVNFYKALEEFFVKLSEIIDYLEVLIRYINTDFNKAQTGIN